jgi:VCBS repeat-containing protein
MWNSGDWSVHRDMRPLITVAVLVFLAQTAPASAQSTPPSFNPLVNVSNTAGQVSDLAAVTADGATIYVAWHEEVAGGQQIRLRRSTNGGVSFIDGASGRVAATVDPAETVHTVRVAASGAVVYVLYTSGVEPRLSKARLARSADGGVTFAAPVTLADTVEFGGSAFADLAVDGAGAVHVVIEDRDLSEDIFYLFSTDQGVTFSTPAALAGSPDPSVRPRVAATGLQIAVVWQELLTEAAVGEVAFIYSADAGASFGPMQNLSANAVDSKNPAVAIGNVIHVAWSEGDSLMLRSSIDGADFTLAAPVGIAPPGQTIAGSALGSSANTVHVSWTTVDADGLMNGPFYRRSTDGGGTFAATQDLRLDLGGAPAGDPAIINGAVARIVWPHTASGFASDTDVVSAGQPNCGISWAAPVSGNWNDATKWSPAVIPGVGSSACITVEGAAPYTVTVAGGQNAGELTVGHATTEVRPIVRITGSLTIGNSLVNSGEITFGSGGRIASTAGIVVNTERGRIGTAAGAAALLGTSLTNHGEVVFAASVTTFNNTRVFTNHGSWTIEAGATFTVGLTYTFTQSGGVLDVKGVALMASSNFNFLGGDISGEIRLEQLAGLHIGDDADGPGTFVFRFGNNIPGGTTKLSGKAGPNHTIKILACCNTNNGNITVVAASGFINGGTVILGAEPTNTAQGATLAGGALLNTGTILIDPAGGGTRRLDMDVENRGTFDVRHNLGMFGTTGRTFTNLGTMTVAAGATVTFGSGFVFNQNGGVLENAGHVEMSAEFSTAGDTFNFNDGTVVGVVIIQGHSRLNIGPGSEGAGTFIFERNVSFGVSSGGHLSGNIAAAQTVRLRGTVGGTSQAIVAAGFTNFGTLVLESTAANAGGVTLVLTDGTLVNRATLAVNDILAGAKALRGHLENRGTMTVHTPLSLQLDFGTFNNHGDVTVGSAGKITLAKNAVVTQHGGTLTLDGPIELGTEFSSAPDVFNFNGGNIVGGAGVHLTSTSRLNIGDGAAASPARFVYRLIGTTGGGTISGNIGTLMTVRMQGSVATAANGLTKAGAIVITTEAAGQGAGLAVTNGVLVNDGTITVEGTATAAPLNAVIQNHGRITIRDTILLNRLAAAHLNDGVVEISAGNIFTISGNSVFRNQAPGRFEGGGTLSVATGTVFFGVGTLGVNVNNAGHFRPGASPGTIDVSGNYTQTLNGRLQIEIQGSLPGSGHDRVNVAGTATLAGALDVVVAAGLCVENSYTVMTYTAVGAADFATKTGLTGLSGGRTLQSAKGAAAYALNAVGPPCNTAPAGTNDDYSVDEDGVLSVTAPGVLVNDTDAEANPLTAVLVAGPSRGVLQLNPNGSLSYTPDANDHGTFTFTYRPNDGVTDGNATTATIIVNARNDAPVAEDDGFGGDEDTAIAGAVLANDTDVDDATLSASLVSNPSHGSLTLSSDGTFKYTPQADFNGLDSFIYRASDAMGAYNEATVRLTVAAMNDAPAGNPDTFGGPEDTVVGGNVLGNDTDIDGPPLSASLAAGPAHGEVVLNGDGSFTYTPHPDFHGSDGFTYIVSDGALSAGPVAVTLTIDSVNDAPVGIADEFTGQEDTAIAGNLLANDSDVDNSALTAGVVTGPDHGTLILNADGSFAYTPHANYYGPDRFTYQVSDGALTAGPITASLRLAGVNDPPTLAAVPARSINADTATAFALDGHDVDGDALTFTATSLPAGASLDPSTGEFSWTPSAADTGTHTIAFTATDPAGLSATRMTTITVVPVNQAPVCSAARASVTEIWPPNGRLVPVDALGVSDADGDPIAITFTAMLQNGVPAVDATGVGRGQALVTAARSGQEKSGRTYELLFRASDGRGGVCEGAVTVVVPHDRGKSGK